MQQAFDLDDPAQLEIRLASGDIEIDPTLDGRVEVELTAHDEESQRLVDETRIEQNGRPGEGGGPPRGGGGWVVPLSAPPRARGPPAPRRGGVRPPCPRAARSAG